MIDKEELIKVGILVNDYSNIKNWELSIINAFAKNKDIDVFLVDSMNFSNKSKYKFKDSILDLLIKLQFKIEKRMSNNLLSNVFKNSQEIISKLKLIRFLPNERGSLVEYKPELDLIIDLKGIKENESLLKIAKFGFFQITYNGMVINENLPSGIIEKFRQRPSIELDVYHFSVENINGVLIDKGLYNFHWSAIRNNYCMLNNAATLLIKNVILFNNKTSSFLEPFESGKTVHVSIWNFFKYVIQFYGNVLNKLFAIIKFKYLGLKLENWTLFIGNNDCQINESISKAIKISLPRNEFWADPFLFEYKGELFAFFEKFTNKTSRGVISCGKVVGQEIVNVIDVLDLNYHLSYPNIFEEDGEIYMIPETSENNRLEIYKCIKFPEKWILFSTGFDGNKIVDTIYYKDAYGDKWLFFNKTNNPLSDNCSELYIYRIDSLKLNKIEEHKQNPVIVNAQVARNGGAIFNYENKLIRPSQNNSYGIYGYNINFNEIRKLNIDEYEEILIKEYSINFKNLKRIHHFHQFKNNFVFDGY